MGYSPECYEGTDTLISMYAGIRGLGLRLKEFWIVKRGQDLIEYALLAGFLAVSAAALVPNMAPNISTIFSQVITMLSTSPSGSQASH